MKNNKLIMKKGNTIIPLKEDTVGDLTQEAEATFTADELEDAFDRALRVARDEQEFEGSDSINVILVGIPGIAKTARVKAWAKKRGITLISKKASIMRETELGGVPAPVKDENGEDVMTKLPNATIIKQLDNPDAVLFFDELNRANMDVRGTLLTLINDHEIEDRRVPVTGIRSLHFLFTIAAINPASSSKGDSLDPAEIDRFFLVMMVADKEKTLDHLESDWGARIARMQDNDPRKVQYEGRLAMARKILQDPKFEFETEDDLIQKQATDLAGTKHSTSPRGFKRALLTSDGTKDDFLSVWNHMCSAAQKPLIDTILSDYEDVQDKATDALANSGGFAQKKQTANDKYHKWKADRGL